MTANPKKTTIIVKKVEFSPAKGFGQRFRAVFKILLKPRNGNEEVLNSDLKTENQGKTSRKEDNSVLGK